MRGRRRAVKKPSARGVSRAGRTLCFAALEIATSRVIDACNELEGKRDLDFFRLIPRWPWLTPHVNRLRTRHFRVIDEFDIDHRNAQLYDAVASGHLKLACKQDGGPNVTNYEVTDAGMEAARQRCEKHRLDFYDLIEAGDYATVLALVIYDDPMMVGH